MYTVDFAYILPDADGVPVEHYQHILDLFSEATWLRVIGNAGFQPKSLTGPNQKRVFIGVRPKNRQPGT